MPRMETLWMHQRRLKLVSFRIFSVIFQNMENHYWAESMTSSQQFPKWIHSSPLSVSWLCRGANEWSDLTSLLAQLRIALTWCMTTEYAVENLRRRSFSRKFKNDENLIFLKPWNFMLTPLYNFRKKLKANCKTIWLPCRWLRSLTQWGRPGSMSAMSATSSSQPTTPTPTPASTAHRSLSSTPSVTVTWPGLATNSFLWYFS